MKRIIFVFLACLCLAGIYVVADLVVSDQNLVALHKSTSSQYNPDCLASACHDTLMQDEKSLSPQVESIHQKMVPYMPGYNPRKDPTSATCRHCHRSVDLINNSAAALRQNVSPQNCAVCHSFSGPGILLFK